MRQHNVVWLGEDTHVLKSSSHSTHAELGSLIAISVVLHVCTRGVDSISREQAKWEGRVLWNMWNLGVCPWLSPLLQ